VNEVLLKGVVGSTAYGLAHEGSDVDYLGVFAAPTREVLGLHPGKDSVVHKDPDTTLHEAKKFVQLVLNGNPSVSELLWLDEYEKRTYLGAHLVDIRKSFLSAPRVRDAYMGYATSQFGRLIARDDGSFSADTRKRSEKHARHLVRLVEQGFRLYVHGELKVNLTGYLDPEWVFDMGRKIADDPRVAAKYMVEARERFDGAKTCLPGYPDEAPVEQWLLEVRKKYWTEK
jgi:predicted nucleotidyltransferase